MSNENRNPTIVDSLVGIGYAPFTESIDGGYTYENIVWLPDLEGGGRSFTASPQGDFKKVVANGKTVIMFKKRSGYDIKVTLMSLIDDVKEAWLGQKTTTSGGFAEYADSKPTSTAPQRTPRGPQRVTATTSTPTIPSTQSTLIHARIDSL